MNKLLFSILTFLVLNLASLQATGLDYENNEDFKKMTDLLNSVLTSTINKTDFTSSSSYPKLDIQNKADAYVYEFNLAGIDKKDIKLSINTKDMLVLEGKKENKNTSIKDGYIKQEIFHGNFKRSVKLPEDANQDKLTTKYTNGILTITIPKQALKNISSKLIPIN